MDSEKKWLKNKAMIIMLAVIIIAASLILPGLNNGLVGRTYTIDSPDIGEPINIALVTDLHSCDYGNGQQELIAEIDSQKPDFIALSGDIFDDVLDNANTEAFISSIAGRYPCYYVTGNHEYYNGTAAFRKKMGILEKYDIPILSGSCETITINGEPLNICGVDDPYDRKFAGELGYTGMESQLEAALSAADNGNFTILLSHRPELFDTYQEHGFDLVLSGHAHGGQWRIPGILNGLYAPDQGLFPDYAGGKYSAGGTTMIVSRGLARESTRIPRIYNPPELVMIEII